MYLNTILAPPSAKYSQSLGSSIEFYGVNFKVSMSFRLLFVRNSINRSCCNQNKFFGNKSISETSKLEKSEITRGKEPATLSKTWSQKQMPKYLALRGARFETVDITKQPNPAAAIDLIAKVPVIEVHENIVACDGGGDKLGHPKVFINLVNSLFFLLKFRLFSFLGSKTSSFVYLLWLALSTEIIKVYCLILITELNASISFDLSSVSSEDRLIFILKSKAANLNFASSIDVKFPR